MVQASRRSLLGAIGVAAGGATMVAAEAADAAQTVAPAASVAMRPAGTVTTLADLAARPVRPGELWQLRESGREGLWAWRDGDLSRQVAEDPLHGLYLAHVTVAPRRGCWARCWDHTTGRAEWFGARADAPDIDNTAALQAALDLCPTVELASGNYHMLGTLRLTRNGSRLIGAGYTQTDQGASDRATQIICSSPDATIIEIGRPGATQPGQLCEAVQLRDLTVRRSVAPFIPEAGLAGAVGIALNWCVNCRVERVFSIDSARGWSCRGTVETYITGCSALRGRAGSRPAADFFIGFHLDYAAPLAANGGNASLYLAQCRAFGGFGEGQPALAYSAGLRTDAGWVDLYIDAFETGTLAYGIDANGDGSTSGDSFRTEDLIVSNCVLDVSERAAIRLSNADAPCAVQIIGCYLAGGLGGTAVLLENLRGSITLTANQYITSGQGGSGLTATDVHGLRSIGNIHTRLAQPIRLDRVSSFAIADTVNGLYPAGKPALSLTDCSRGRIDTIVSGRPGAYAAGVHLLGTGNSHVEICATNLDPAALAGGDPVKLLSGTTPVTSAGAFGRACLASGIMS